jgi:hypothetical protein
VPKESSGGKRDHASHHRGIEVVAEKEHRSGRLDSGEMSAVLVPTRCGGRDKRVVVQNVSLAKKDSSVGASEASGGLWDGLDAKILGFSNIWYRPAMDHAELRELEKGLKIRLVAPVYFCASKLEAFAGRGKNDFGGSRDVEDLIAVVDGRGELVAEVQAAEKDVRSYLVKEIKRLLSLGAFNDALPGYVPPDAASQERIGTIILRLEEIASLQAGPLTT